MEKKNIYKEQDYSPLNPSEQNQKNVIDLAWSKSYQIIKFL